MRKIKVLLVEDQTIMRLGLALVLEKSDNIELIGEAEDGIQAVTMAQKLNPDVILMDIGLPEMDGIEATIKIKELKLPSKILMFTSRDSEDDVFSSLSAGANGYIMKGSTEKQIISAITAIDDGTAWLDPQIARLVLSNVRKQNKSIQSNEKIYAQTTGAKNDYDLTERELQVLALIVEGLNNPQIAERLVITNATAKSHVHSILQKLYVQNRTQATITAVKHGLVK